MDFASLAPVSAREAFPELPPEIWQKIFRYTIQLPGAYSHTDADEFVAFTRDQNGICPQTRFKTVMSTKISVSLVCSTWNALIARHMFEYILVHSSSQILRVANIFARHASATNNKRSRPSWWTVRLELALDPAHTWTPEHSLALVYIIKSCPNLTCFSTAFCNGDLPLLENSLILAALAESSNVKRVELKTDLCSLRVVASSLSQSLEMMWVRPSRRACEDQDPWACSLPNLHTFVSHFQFGRILDHLELPSVGTLVVNTPCDRSSIINKSGRHLQYLSVSDIAITLPLLPACQNLIALAINFHEVTLRNFAFMFKSMRFSNIKRLVIEGHTDVDLTWWFTARSVRHSECFRNNLISLASAETFPNLRNVQLVLPLCIEKIIHDSNASSNWRSIWSSWFSTCSERGIAVESAYSSPEWSTGNWQPFRISF